MEQNYISEKEMRSMSPFALRDIARLKGVDSVSGKNSEALISELLALNPKDYVEPVAQEAKVVALETPSQRPLTANKKTNNRKKNNNKNQNYQQNNNLNNGQNKTVTVATLDANSVVDDAQSEEVVAQPEVLDEKVGVLDINPDGYGFLRAENCEYGNKDTYVSARLIKSVGLRPGDFIVGSAKKNTDNKPPALISVSSVNGMSCDNLKSRPSFESLVPIYPNERFTLETSDKTDFAIRCIDLIAPIGKGQRAMIVSPPKAGKTTLLKKIANSIGTNYPDVELFVLLIDERPEEVTDMQRSITGEIIYSTFDETPEHHCKAAELLIEKAKRNVELGKDVVIIMDSLTRLARAYNLTIPPTGRTLSGGMDPGALHNPKKFFGSARNIENGGSLTIIATALVDTGSRMDDVIYEEFKGTGNMEIHLDRKLSERRIFPAIDLNKSSTRREDLLLSQKELEAVFTVRKMLSAGDSLETTEQLMNMLVKTENNKAFITDICAKYKLFETSGFAIRNNGGNSNN